ncbi:hypothetical protein G5B35_14380 [Parapusillimonas sp. SGNA-6]|nr:hypothetical protein [Parapusillimonas sp. SGNA-6]
MSQISTCSDRRQSSIDTLSDLARTSRSAAERLRRLGKHNDEDSAVFADLLEKSIAHGAVLIWHKRLKLQLDINDLREWLMNPIATAARLCDVDRQTFLRWNSIEEIEYTASVKITCRYDRCKRRKRLPFETPKQMRMAEVYATEGVWYCHHHRWTMWEQHKDLSENLLPILEKVQLSTTCNKAALMGDVNELELEFLCSIGLIKNKAISSNSSVKNYSLTLTPAGKRYLEAKVIPQYFRYDKLKE